MNSYEENQLVLRFSLILHPKVLLTWYYLKIREKMLLVSMTNTFFFLSGRIKCHFLNSVLSHLPHSVFFHNTSTHYHNIPGLNVLLRWFFVVFTISKHYQHWKNIQENTSTSSHFKQTINHPCCVCITCACTILKRYTKTMPRSSLDTTDT